MRVAAALCVILMVVGCSASQSGTPSGSGADSTHASLRIDLVDAPAHEFSEVVVSISKVVVHSSSAGWVTVMDTPLTVDLLKLRTQAHTLGLTTLPAGKITQIRLYVTPTPAAYVTLPSGEQRPLMVPSGEQSGIKIKGLIDLRGCDDAAVTLDFDAHKSIWVHGRGNHTDYILRPVIHNKKTHKRAADGCTPATPPGEDPRLDDPAAGLDGGPVSGGGGLDGGTPGRDRPGQGPPSNRARDGGGSSPSDPTSPSQPTDPSEPSEPADPVDPTGPTGPTDPTGPTHPTTPGTGGTVLRPCGTHTDCATSAYCGEANQCVPRFPIGQPCEIDAQCLTGFCLADGRCGELSG